MWKAAIVVMSLSVLSCSDSRIENEWLNPRPAEAPNGPWQELPSLRVHEVRPDMREESVRLLSTQTARRLDAQEAARFVGNDLSSAAGRSFYLLRAVRTVTDGGRYTILTSGRAVAVTYDALSNSTATLKSGVVVDLGGTPQNVYVEIDIAR